jgi:hypothetical protein
MTDIERQQHLERQQQQLERQQHLARIAQIQGRIIDTAGRMVDDIAAGIGTDAPSMRSLPPDVARRQLANMLRLSSFCTNATCRRAQGCRGEPLHCLAAVTPLFPAEAFDGILHKQPARKRRRQQPGLALAPCRA